MSELLKLQFKFSHLLPSLYQIVWDHGCEFNLGDAYRDPRVFGTIGEQKGYGHRNSNHKNRLAVDLNLYKDGKYIDCKTPGDVEIYKAIGEAWEKLDPLCRWGGRFKDYNHFSLKYGTMM